MRNKQRDRVALWTYGESKQFHVNERGGGVWFGSPFRAVLYLLGHTSPSAPSPSQWSCSLHPKQSGAQFPPRRYPPLSPDFPRPPVPPGLAQRGSASGTRAKHTVPSPRADGNVCLVTRPNGRRWVERAGRKDDRYGKGPEVQMNPASTPRCPYRPLPRVKEEERARAPVFHRRVRENTPRVDGTRHEAHGNVHHVSRPTGRRGEASERGADETCRGSDGALIQPPLPPPRRKEKTVRT